MATLYIPTDLRMKDRNVCGTVTPFCLLKKKKKAAQCEIFSPVTEHKLGSVDKS